MRILLRRGSPFREDRHLAIFSARAFSSEAASVFRQFVLNVSIIQNLMPARVSHAMHAELFTLTPSPWRRAGGAEHLAWQAASSSSPGPGSRRPGSRMEVSHIDCHATP